MHADDGAGAGGDHGGDGSGSDVLAVAVYVGKHGGCPSGDDARNGGEESTGGDNDFITCVNVEGCLSVPNFDGEVERAKSVRVKYQDRSGKPIVLDATELMAIAVQHEVDHLDGILFIDKANALIPKE